MCNLFSTLESIPSIPITIMYHFSSAVLKRNARELLLPRVFKNTWSKKYLLMEKKAKFPSGQNTG